MIFIKPRNYTIYSCTFSTSFLSIMHLLIDRDFLIFASVDPVTNSKHIIKGKTE